MTARGMLAAFDQIAAGTRATLAAVPEGRMDWRPHKRSWTLGDLATHIANLPNWALPTLAASEFDVAPADGSGPPPMPTFATREELLQGFDAGAEGARAAIAGADDEKLAETWTMLVAGEPRFTLPKGVVLRTFILDHLIHHRAQLGVYLRMLDVPVPPVFGPTADFPDF